MESVAVGGGGGYLTAQHAGVGVGDKHGGCEAGLLNTVDEIPSEVPEHRGVVVMKLGCRGSCGDAVTHGHLQVHAPTPTKHPMQFAQCLVGVGDVLQHMRRDDQIQRARRQIYVLEINLHVSFVGAVVEIAGPVVEPVAHHGAVLGAEAWAGLQHSRTA